MQLKLILSGAPLRLPLASSSILQGLLYAALKEDCAFSHQLHETGYTLHQRKFKLFSFSELQGKYRVENKQIIYDEPVSMEIRSVDAYMIQLLYAYFLQHKTVSLGNNTVTVEHIELQDKTVFAEKIRIRTISPITVYQTTEDGHTLYFSPDEPAFYQSIVENAKRKWLSFSDDASKFSLSVSPVPNTTFSKRATAFKETFITAWHGNFILEGNPEILSFLFQTGLGSKNSQGFGLFDVIS